MSNAILQSALARLKKANPLASVRSLAAQLELSPSYLSKVFRGERPVSANLLGRLTKVLQLDHLEVAQIQREMLLQFENEKLGARTGIRTLEPGDSSTANYSLLGKADFWMLEDWFTLPLLNLATTENFESSPTKIASRLGISIAQAERCIFRLIEVGFLARADNGDLTRTHMKLRFPTQRSHAAVRRHHEIMGQKAVEALRQTPSEEEFAERLISGVAFACNPSKLAEAKVILEDAIYKAANLLSSDPCTEVFQLNLQLFKLTKKSP